MCGRLNVSEDPLVALISEALDVDLNLKTNHDVRPSQEVATIVGGARLTQQNALWGIKPSWSKRLLINAQAESVAEKPTFRRQFAHARCVVPCSGWYEWSTIAGSKRKYHFSSQNGRVLFMGGILYKHSSETAQLVTLTTAPNPQCAPYHHRMPVLIHEHAVKDWLSLPAAELGHLLVATGELLAIQAAA